MTAHFPAPAPTPASAASLQRVRGVGRLSVKAANGASRLATWFQEGSAKLRMPRALPGKPCEAVMINTAGGLTAGDRIEWAFSAGENASLMLTTQASEKTYRSVAGLPPAEVNVSLSAAAGSSLFWLPQETILFERSALRRTITVDADPSARLLLLEPIVFGRKAMGETLTQAFLHDRWRIRHGKHLVHAEDTRFGPDIAASLAGPAALGDARAMATLLYIGPDAESKLECARAIVGTVGGASFWQTPALPNGKLLARLIAADGYGLRKHLIPLVELFAGEGSLPRVWSL